MVLNAFEQFVSLGGGMIGIPVGVRYMVLSALAFALMGACVKAASQRGIPVLEIVAARALISAGISYIDIKRKGISPWGHDKTLLTARGLIGTLALMCVFYAVTTLPLAEATLLQYLHPVFTSVLAFLFLKESIQRSTVMCIVLSLTGLLIMVPPGFLFGAFAASTNPLPLLGVGAALLGALGSGTAYVLIRRLSTTEDPSVIIFYFPFIALPVSCLLLGDDFVMPTGLTWLLLLLVGLFTQVAQYSLTRAMQTEDASKATAYSYVQVIFAAILGWMLFDEIPTANTLLGALFIIGGALVNIIYRKR
ncbi:MAG: DMT family transporter [Desulfobacterales bacterium]|nr:DMT family transporter [Desulfobacterales bacterium]